MSLFDHRVRLFHTGERLYHPGNRVLLWLTDVHQSPTTSRIVLILRAMSSRIAARLDKQQDCSTVTINSTTILFVGQMLKITIS